MAGTRSYVRGNNGRFAGKGAGTKVTQGRAGGFANASFRSRVAQSRVARGKGSSTKPRATFGTRAARLAHNKKIQKAATQLTIAGGIAAYNKKKHGISPTEGIKPIINAVKGAASAARPGGGNKVHTITSVKKKRRFS